MKAVQFTKSVFKLFLLAFLISLSGCNNDSSVNNPILKEFNETSQGNYSVTDEHVIIVRNFIGSLMVNGEGLAYPSVRWFVNKKVEAESQEKANEIFALITPAFRERNDTIIVELDPGTIPYVHALLELEIPYYMICRIEKVIGNTYISNLDTLLSIHDASNVEVIKHRGSCEISSGEGNIYVEIALPDNGFCRLNVNTGNISINIPQSTSATVYAKTSYGTVSHANLTLTNIQLETDFLSGILGEGHGEIRAVIYRGNIELKAL
jgi:hypothetical protein